MPGLDAVTDVVVVAGLLVLGDEDTPLWSWHDLCSLLEWGEQLSRARPETLANGSGHVEHRVDRDAVEAQLEVQVAASVDRPVLPT